MQTRLIRVVAAVLFLSAFAHAAGPATRTEYDSGFYKPSQKIVTPHIPWANPYAQGKVNALIVCPREAMREVVELSQRLSLQYEAVFTEGRSKLGMSGTERDASWTSIKGNSEEEIANDLRTKVEKRHDAIIIGSLDWSILPIDIRYQILKAVKNGTGLLLVGVGKPDSYLPEVLKMKGDDLTEYLTAGFPFQGLPAFEKEKDARAFLDHRIQSARLGKGRVLALRGGAQVRHFLCPGKSNPDEPEIDYDYHLSLAIKGILWVARKEPNVLVASNVPFGAKFDRTDLAQKGIEFTLTNAGPSRRLDLTCILRTREGRPVWTGEVRGFSLDAGAKTVKFTPPVLAAGTYLADLFATDWGRAVSWGSGLIEVTSPCFIAGITLEKEAVGQAEPVRGKVLLGRCASGQEIVLTQVDNWLRITAEKHLPLKEGMTEAAFEIRPSAPPLTILQNLQARLTAGNDTLDAKTVEFSVTDLYDDHSDFRFVMWASIYDSSFIDRSAWRLCREYGCDTFYTAKPLMSALRENLHYIPYITRFVDTKTDWCRPKPTRMKGDLIRDPCLTDPEYREKTRNDLRAKSETCRKYSVHDVSLGDECLFVAGPWDLCFSPTCVKDFQEFVKKDYGDLARLNAEYGTSYKGWDEVKPITLDEARKAHNPAPWVDHRRHMEAVWAGFHGYARRCIREVMPQARVGHEGSNTQVNSFQAGDLWQLMRNMDFNCIYVRPWTVLQLRDFGDPGIMSSYWYGGYEPHRNEPMQRRAPWFALLNGMTSQWEWLNYGGAGAVVAYDLTPYPFFEGAIEEIREIKRGVGKLLISTKRQHSGVAVLFSPSSVHANSYAPVLANTSYENVLGAYLEAAKHVGITVRLLAYEELADGRLNSGEFKALILPIAQALSEREVAEIKKFAKAGGTVIADLKPGTCDEHGKLQSNALDDLFGVKIAAAGEKRRTGSVVILPDKAAVMPGLAKWSLPDISVDELISATTGEPLGRMEDVPAIIRNKYGRGQGIYLNFAFPQYMTIVEKRNRTAKDYEDGEGMRALVRALLALAGVEPPVILSPAIPCADISRFKDGDAEYIGILQDLPEDPMKYTRKEERTPGQRLYTLKLPRKSHVYDVRERCYLGYTDSVLTGIAPARAKLFAMMPHPVLGLALSGDKQVRRGDSIRYKVSVQPLGAQVLPAHIVRLDVHDPSGRLVECYSRNILALEGTGEGVIHLAMNDPPGLWRLQARDVVSGKEAALWVNVTRQQPTQE